MARSAQTWKPTVVAALCATPLACGGGPKRTVDLGRDNLQLGPNFLFWFIDRAMPSASLGEL